MSISCAAQHHGRSSLFLVAHSAHLHFLGALYIDGVCHWHVKIYEHLIGVVDFSWWVVFRLRASRHAAVESDHFSSKSLSNF